MKKLLLVVAVLGALPVYAANIENLYNQVGKAITQASPNDRVELQNIINELKNIKDIKEVAQVLNTFSNNLSPELKEHVQTFAQGFNALEKNIGAVKAQVGGQALNLQGKAVGIRVAGGDKNLVNDLVSGLNKIKQGFQTFIHKGGAAEQINDEFINFHQILGNVLIVRAQELLTLAEQNQTAMPDKARQALELAQTALDGIKEYNAVALILWQQVEAARKNLDNE